MFKRIDFEEMGVNINGEKLNHLRFAEDIVLIADRIDETNETPDCRTHQEIWDSL